MAAPDDEIEIRYTVKELLRSIRDEQTAGFARMEASMAGKADKSDLAVINARLDEHGTEIGRIKDRMRVDEATQEAVQKQRAVWRDWRRWAIGIVALVVAAIPAFIALVHP